MVHIGISNIEIFKLMDVLSVNDAASLIAGASPTDVSYDEQYDQYYLHRHHPSDYGDDIKNAFLIARKSLMHAITLGRLKAHIVPATYNQKLYKSSLEQDWIATHGIDSEHTIIDRDNLKEWLEKRGVYPPFLFPNGKKDNYMNPDHHHYAPKLALCVKAWEVAQTANLQGETYKQFMCKWMIENAKLYKVENDNPKEFDKLASISNWATKGGRAKSQSTPPLSDNHIDKEDDLTVHQELVTNLPTKPLLLSDDPDIPF